VAFPFEHGQLQRGSDLFSSGGGEGRRGLGLGILHVEAALAEIGAGLVVEGDLHRDARRHGQPRS
jgi:hypothetical protein